VTLLELMVVLVLLGLVLAVVAPAFIVPAAASTSDLASSLATARRAAVLRGEPVTLTVDDTGAWRVDGDASPTAPAIAMGRLASTVGRLRVRFSPLGTCVPEPVDRARVADWNALGCSLTSSGSESRP
jgi:hypothetical protein